MIKVGSDFSGVGAFNQALKRLGIDYQEAFACDMDIHARTTFIHNYGEPKNYPTDVYEREIPEDSLDIYMTSPPCQAFSLAGKRQGENDEKDRGILFYNSHEFIMKNKPRFFIFENVKGLLSDDGGKTFQRWCAYLGGKSVNGNPTIFPMEESVPYHIYYKVLNAKNYGVPQNRERIFIIGIRDDEDNTFRFPVEERLLVKLKHVLEDDVDEKYYLNNTQIEKIINSKFTQEKERIQYGDVSGCLLSRDYKDPKCIPVNSANKKGYEEAFEGDSISLQQPNSEARRGRVGNQVAQTLDTGCSQAVILGYTRDKNGNVVSRHEKDTANTIHSSTGGGGNTDQFVKIGAMRGRGENNTQQLEINDSGNSNSLTTVQKDNLVVTNRIRKLTPRECFRLMDFPDSFDFSVVSNTQAYKQAGNSIVVSVLEKIIANLRL